MEEAEGEAKKEKIKPDEFISGMGKKDKFIPVITIVIYYGREKSWDGAKTLYELLDIKEGGEEILPFISNYRLNVFDYHEYDDFGQFHSKLQLVFEFLRYAGDEEALGKGLTKNKEKYKKLSSQAKILLVHLTNIKEIPNVKKEELQKGEFDMCKAFEDVEKKGKMEGIKEGIKEGMKKGIEEGRAEEIIESGYEFKLSEKDILARLQNKLKISQEAAEKYFSKYKKRTA